MKKQMDLSHLLKKNVILELDALTNSDKILRAYSFDIVDQSMFILQKDALCKVGVLAERYQCTQGFSKGRIG